jgi:hypothetical protein
MPVVFTDKKKCPSKAASRATTAAQRASSRLGAEDPGKVEVEAESVRGIGLVLVRAVIVVKPYACANPSRTPILAFEFTRDFLNASHDESRARDYIK